MVKQVQIEPLVIPLHSPLKTARGTISERCGFRIAVSDDTLTGWGVAMPLPGWSESLSACRTALGIESAESYTGPMTAIPIYHARADKKRANPAAAFGVELALADLAARQAAIPLATYLNESVPLDTIPVNATIGGGESESRLEEVQTAVDAGFSAIKLKIGMQSMQTDIETIERIQHQFGNKLSIRIDANGSFSFDQATEFLEALPAHSVEYIEQPLPADDIEAHSKLRQTGVPIAVDESLSVTSPQSIIEAGAADVLVCKPMAIGGVDAMIDLSTTARANDIDLVMTTTFDGVIGRLGAVHLASALRVNTACGFATAEYLDESLELDPTRIINGEIPVPSGPGLTDTNIDTLST
jgi:o-succinylbenzoate synthase